ncbi:MAG: hypothetical protein JWO31_1384 [Phycisphaerales bacterium]|nr:hypothetical protein [Phycisphaerales bacterium]
MNPTAALALLAVALLAVAGCNKTIREARAPSAGPAAVTAALPAR